MSLWVDKYRPSSLDKLSYHQDLSTNLKRLANTGDLPHLLVYGPSGAGKKTRIVALLREVYGPGVEKLKIDLRRFETPSRKSIELNVVTSNYHLELNPSDVGIYDRIVVQDMIKEVAQTQQVDTNAQRKFKVVVINEADALSKDAQHALRRTMEKYMANIRIILCCNSTSKIISPIRSRCLSLRVAAPTTADIVEVLSAVAKRESLKLSPALAERIAEASERNLRRAVLMLETARVQQYPFTADQTVPLADWQQFIKGMAQSMIQEQSPKRMLEVRGYLYELLTHCIPPSIVLRTLAFELIGQVDQQLKPEICRYAAFYEHRLVSGQKAIFHLEAFVAKFMSIYKRYLMEMYG
ncbi:Replication factor C (RF-C) subunit [Dimargaris cristalligena]|uniref:Replication factor C subunit 5 n=1 Tax=Dimargaris cristalligena TaxID=215637 RepID=A0A4P9ZVJ0_9FUNG|nr:Replication factor C (RF-C) subunit [Dimargaris cristalligena]RKP36951.1 P-loop containing nucleoside triphosphate hydrolase protein [Dimargaris cristalligena]|eukprot:RKP36951.1 P-loop containing nucleoside triphosphate hydrolase protein [Dimargaris cristalligena]